MPLKFYLCFKTKYKISKGHISVGMISYYSILAYSSVRYQILIAVYLAFYHARMITPKTLLTN